MLSSAAANDAGTGASVPPPVVAASSGHKAESRSRGRPGPAGCSTDGASRPPVAGFDPASGRCDDRTGDRPRERRCRDHRPARRAPAGRRAHSRSSARARRPASAGAAHPGVVHAPGRPLAAGVPRASATGIPMLESCFTTDLVIEITLQPVRRYGVDAAIFFSDIVVPLKAIGVDLDIVPGVGPVVAQPFRTEADVDRLRDLDAGRRRARARRGHGADRRARGHAAHRFRRRAVHARVVPGGGRAEPRPRAAPRRSCTARPDVWHALLGRLAEIAGTFLRQQVLAGASAVQLFDSWVGALPARDYREYVQPHSRTALLATSPTSACRGSTSASARASCSPTCATPGADVVGVDFRVPLSEAARRVGPDHALQGNLDPARAVRRRRGGGGA